MKSFRYSWLCCLLVIPAATSAQQVVIYADSVLQNMPQYGYNQTYSHYGHGLLDSTTYSLRPSMITVLGAIRPDLMRFPGGTISNTYKWKRAVGPQNQRVDQVHGWSGATSNYAISSAFGPDEAAQFMESADGSLIICVSFNETAADAADYVEYMNAAVGANPNGGKDWAAERAANGHPEPYGVKYWEIGNESGGIKLKTWTSWPYDGDDNQEDGVNQGSDTARQWWTYGGEKQFTNQKAVRIDSWADEDITATATPNDTWFAKFPPVQNVTVNVGPTPETAGLWMQVSDFESSGSNDRHYILDTASGSVTFGDGNNGDIPPAGTFVYLDYTSGAHDSFVDFYTQMKAVDPNIHISASYHGLLIQSGTLPDVVFDGYQQHGGGYHKNFDGPLNNDGFTDAIGRGYGAFREIIDATLRTFDNLAVPASTDIVMSEFSMAGKLTDATGVNQAHTIAGALMMGLCMEAASNYPRVAVVSPNYFKNSYEQAGCHVSPDEVIKSQGRAMQMFTRYFGRQRLFVQADLSTRPVNWRKNGGDIQTANVPNVVLAAARNSADDLTIMGINTTQSESTTLEFDIQGGMQIDGATSVDSWTLRADSPTAINDVTTPDAVRIDHEASPVVDLTGDTFAWTFAPSTITIIRLRNVTAAACDVNADGEVDIWDVAEVAKVFGQKADTQSPADVNTDGEIDIWDVAAIAKWFGQKVVTASHSSMTKY
jgi:alpha-L-arabinofuranosidase